MTDAHSNGWTAPDRPDPVPQHPAMPPGAYPHYVPMPVPPGWPPGAPMRRGVPLADFWQRLLAHVIDQMVLSAVASVLAIPFGVVMYATIADSLPEPGTTRTGQATEIPPELWLLYGAVFVLTLVLLFLYQAVSVAKWGATLGKKAMKLRVVRVTNGGRVGWPRAITRAGIGLLFGVIPCVSLLDAAWLLWDKPNRQALHDKVAGTIVIRVDYAPVGPVAEFTG